MAIITLFNLKSLRTLQPYSETNDFKELLKTRK